MGLSSCLILLGSGLIYSYTGLTNLDSIYNFVSTNYYDNNLTSFFTLNFNVSAASPMVGGEWDKGVILGLILIFSGLLFKIAASPFHNWSPDVYDDAPTIVTIWLTIMPKISIIIFLLELHSQIGIIGNNVSITEVIDLLGGASSIQTHMISNGGQIIAENTVYVLKNLLLISSLLSLIIGTVVGLAQSRIKRLFAC